MGEVKIGANGVDKIYLGDKELLRYGLQSELLYDNIFNPDYICIISFVNNSSVDITIRIDDKQTVYGEVINTADILIPAKSVILGTGAASIVGGMSRVFHDLTIMTNVHYTSYNILSCYFTSNTDGVPNYSMTNVHKENIENIVENAQNVISYRASWRYGNPCMGVFYFND